MKRIIINLLEKGTTSSKKTMEDVAKFWYPFKQVFKVNDNGFLSPNNNPFWDVANEKNRKELIADLKAIEKRNVKDRSYYHMLVRYENGDGYGIVRDFSEQEVQKKSNETILAKIGILLFENLECAKYECKHANDSHTLANANGKRAMITTVMDGFHSILEESEDAQKVKDVISEYEKQYREYNKKVSIIVEASDYTLCEDSDSGEIEEIISDLEGVGIEITEENRDIIIEYILGEEEDDDEE